MADRNGDRLQPLPFAVGMLIGGVTGFLIWMATDTFALFPAFLGIGVGLGIVLSEAAGRRRR
jgi:hypothetical protein